MIKTIIVDDEPLALDILETFIAKVPDLELVARCENAIEAGEALKDNEVDLMFLDIQMPQITGIEFLKSLQNPPCVVFTTAFPDYALEGFELNAVDYLLKPISTDRFLKAYNKVVEKLGNKKSSEDESQDDFIYVKADKKLIKVKYEDIIYIEGLKDYVQIKHDTGRIITLQTMKALEAKLPSHIFKRIHRSYIINFNKLKAVDGNSIEVIEKGQVKNLPIGKNYRDDLLASVNAKKL